METRGARPTSRQSNRIGDLNLATLRRRLERWRARCRGPSGRIPEALWAAAVERAQRDGVERIADALDLNVHALRRRVEAGSTGAPAPPPKPVFVELALGAPASPWQLDVESPTGAKLSLRLTGPVPDLLGLLATFLRARA